MSSLHKKSLIATAAIFCCRFTGLLREIVYTRLFGATGALDAFMTAFRIPNMLRDMFAEGALSQSFTSVMSKVDEQKGADAAWKLANRIFTQLTSLMVCLVAIGVMLAGTFMQALYPERAQLEIIAPPLELPAGTNENDYTFRATFQGLRTNADGFTVATFATVEPIGLLLDNEACIRLKLVEDLKTGDLVRLSTTSRKGCLQVERRNFIGLATDLCRIMWPFILLASVSALCMGALNVFGSFGIPNLASAAFNITTIVCGAGIGYYIDPQFGPNALYGFAIAVVLGGIAQVLVQLPKLHKEGWTFEWNIGISLRHGLHFKDSFSRRVWFLMLPGVIAAGITQVNIFINTSFALYLEPGSVTALSCGFHLWQLPVALFGVAVGMVVLPTVSRMTLKSGNGEITDHLAKALRFMAVFAVPSAVFLSQWGMEIASVFFQGGRFDADAAELTGAVLASYSIGLLGYAGMKVLQPIFLALEKPWIPAFLALAICAVSIGLNYVFVMVLGMPAQYLALTTSVVTTLNFLFYFFFLRRMLGGMSCGVLIPGVLRICAAGAVLALTCFVARSYLFDGFTDWSFMMRFLAMALGGIAGAALYVGACFFFDVPEIVDCTAYLRKRLAGGSAK